ncbi:LysE family translocator [Streptomyces sp. NPDC059209]|uniref:LysE family translocator n=1 Tax=Streptomyces sp. NPDC059209 TaxID=3346769 RepID=UPI00367DBEF2
MASVLGNALGGYALVVAVALGVGTLVETSVVVFNVIKLAGAGYLIYLGVKALRAGWKSRARAASFAPVPSSARGSVGAGFMVGVTNQRASCSSRRCCPSSSTGRPVTSAFRY